MVATPISSKILAEIRAFVVVKHPGATGEQIMLVLAKLNTCYHLNLILGSCLGTKNSMLAGEVKDKSSSEEERVFRTSRGERFGTKNSKSCVQVTSSEEEGVFWTSRCERFGAKNSKSAVQVTFSEEEEVVWTSRRERLVRENKYDRRGRDHGGDGYRGRSKPYECPMFMENQRDENKLKHLQTYI